MGDDEKVWAGLGPAHGAVVRDAIDGLRNARIQHAPDPINPDHYKHHPAGIECITITEHFNFNVGNAIKYLWRMNEKGDPKENLRKAAWYIDRELTRLARQPQPLK